MNRSTLILIIALTFMASLASLLFQLLNDILQPGSRQWENAIKRLRQTLDGQRQQLIPWDGKDLLPLLSYANFKTKSGWFSNSTVRTGQLDTIFQEPVAAIADMPLGKHRIALAQTAQHEWIFRLKEKEIEIWLNNQPFAVLAEGHLLTSGRQSKLLAQIQASNDERNVTVAIANQAAFTLANPKFPPVSPNPRALMLLRTLSAEEELICLGMLLGYQLRMQAR